jgi:hypothetical protein
MSVPSAVAPAADPDPDADPDVKAARERREWLQSPEWARAKRATRIFFYATPVVAILAGLIAWLYTDTSGSISVFQNQNNIIFIAAGATAGIWAYAGYAVALFQRQRARRGFRDRQLLGEAREELKEAEKELIGGSEDFRTLWGITQKQLDYYHKIRQVRQSAASCTGRSRRPPDSR